MTEQEWLDCGDVIRMLRALVNASASARKVRLFGCAAVRSVWHMLKYPDSRICVEEGERAADTEVRRWVWDKTHLNGRMALQHAAAAWMAADDEQDTDSCLVESLSAEEDAARAALLSHNFDISKTVEDVCRYVASVRVQCGMGESTSPHLAVLLRDVVNPHYTHGKPPLTRDTVVMAQAAYKVQHRQGCGHLDPVRLTVLADSLEESGADPLLFSHLRGPGPHVRGCWALDLVLDKE